MNPKGTEDPWYEYEFKQKTMFSIKLSFKNFSVLNRQHDGQRSYGIKTMEVKKRTSTH